MNSLSATMCSPAVEPAAIVVVDAVVRLLPGALGYERSAVEFPCHRSAGRASLHPSGRVPRLAGARGFCCRVITPGLRPGDASKPCCARSNAGPTCWRGRQLAPQERAWLRSRGYTGPFAAEAATETGEEGPSSVPSRLSATARRTEDSSLNARIAAKTLPPVRQVLPSSV